MTSLFVKSQQQLRISDGTEPTFHIRKSQTNGSRSVTGLKGKYKLSFLSPSSSNLSLNKSSITKESLLPEISTLHTNEENLNITQPRFASPKVSQKLAPIRSSRGRNAQSLDLRSIRHQNSKKDDSFEYLAAIQQPSNRNNNKYPDENPKNTVGTEAVNNFYLHYKRLDKIIDQNSFKEIKDSVYTSFLKREEDLALFPSKLGLIKDFGDKRHIIIDHFRIGDKYAETLGEGFKALPHITSYRLANNRLSSKGADFILARVSRGAQYIDLSNNQIGRIGCEHLLKTLENTNSKLVTLNLEGNKLGDTSVMLLCDGLAINRSLQSLNLSRNCMTNLCTDKLGGFLEQNTSVKELYLYWNQIQGQGGNNILKGLSYNTTLKIIDLAWNSLGQHTTGFAKNFSEFIAVNKDLVVLDISSNQLRKEDSKTISEGLSKNHTLYDFIYQGNYGYVDTFGFLMVPELFQNDIMTQHISLHTQGKYPNLELIKRYDNLIGEAMDGCWLGEGWTPVTFRWTPTESGEGDEDPIYIHISCEGGRAIWLPKTSNYQLQIMCPPTKIEYFFTVRGEQVVAQDQPHQDSKQPYVRIEIDGLKKMIKMPVVNYVNNTLTTKIFDENFEVLCPVKPRIRPEVYIPAEMVKEKTPWTFPISLFKDYKPDTDKCFETDFETSRITKIIKKPEELEKVKGMLRSAYKLLKGAYRYLSAVGITGEIWSIGSNVFTDFLIKSKIIDDILRLKDADLKFIATLTDPSMAKNPRNPEKSLIRYQFLEIWVRLAEQKYITSGTITSYAEAVEKILNEHVLPYITSNDSSYKTQRWRENRYWNEGCDTVYKSYLPVVQALYRKYSGMKTKPGQKKFTCVEELNKLVTDGELLNDTLVERDLVVVFNQSMMTQVDELNSDRIFQMSFIEFLEALARIADIYSAVSPGEDESSVSLEDRKKRHLSLKLEGVIYILFHRAADNTTKDSFVLPDKSIFTQDETEIASLKKKTGKRKCIYRVEPVQYYYEYMLGAIGRTRSDE